MTRIKRDDDEIATVTALSTRTAVEPAGKAALVVKTAQLGTIAFEVDLPTVRALISQLAELEIFLNRKDHH